MSPKQRFGALPKASNAASLALAALGDESAGAVVYLNLLMKERLISVLSVLSQPFVALGGALVLGGGLIGLVWLSTSVSPVGNYTPVTQGSITQSVSVSGIVQAAHSTDLSFEAPGTVAQISVQVGEHVQAGQVLATLNDSGAIAAFDGAKANLEIQQAELASLKAGTRPEQLAIDQTNLTQAQTALGNAIASALVTVDDAVYAKADQVFLNPRTANPQLAIQVPDSVLVIKLQTERTALETTLNQWQAAANSMTAAETETALKSVNGFLADLAQALAETPVGGSVSAAELSAYQTAVNTGRTNVAAALSAVTAADTAEKGAAGALTLAQSGATASDIAAQQAAVDAAQAAVSSAQVAIAYTQIVAPVSGVITEQNANLGETVAPGAPLISMIADGAYEARGYVSENDIGKIALGDAVLVTMDAYPGTTFAATVTTVDPAATTVNGVSSYGVTVTFSKKDPRIKAGLSANLQILTETKANALLVPSSAVITNGSREFVYVKGAHGTATETPVTTGLVSAGGHTEITSGLAAGQEVLTFGASAAF